ncbi:MAG: murein biosynthesis integral membrane protein MurJ [Acidobacteria bacterium]|nr:murein biosynthesis integral membrane protein MurJ [Acidobacteriota bacterium]
MTRSAGAMGAMTLLSRIFGYIRDLLQASILGAADSADAFVIAFRIPNLLRRLVGEGALTAALVPVFTETRQRDGEEAGWRLAATAFWTMGALLLLLTGLGVLFSPTLVRLLAFGFTEVPGKLDLTAGLTRIMFPYLLFIGLTALVMALLNAVRVFAAPAFTPVLLNLSIITFALLAARESTHPATWFAVGVLVGGSLQLGFLLPFILRRAGFLRPRFSLTDPGIRKIGRLMLPGLFGLGVTQLNLVVDSQVASFLGTGSVSYLYYAVRVEELVLGLFVISISTVILPTLARFAVRGQNAEMRATLTRALRYVAFVTVPAAAGLMILRVPIIATLFQRGAFSQADVLLTSQALAFYAVGLLPNGFVKILAPAFYARMDTATPVRVGAFAFLLHVPLCVGLGWWLGYAGIALSTSLAATVNAGGLLILLCRREGRDWLVPVGSTILRLAAATAVMGGVLMAMLDWADFGSRVGLGARAGTLGALIAAGGIAYLLAARLLGAREGEQIWGELRGRGAGSHPESH